MITDNSGLNSLLTYLDYKITERDLRSIADLFIYIGEAYAPLSFIVTERSAITLDGNAYHYVTRTSRAPKGWERV